MADDLSVLDQASGSSASCSACLPGFLHAELRPPKALGRNHLSGKAACFLVVSVRERFHSAQHPGRTLSREGAIYMSGTTQKHHHHEWEVYVTVANILGILTVFAWMLLKSCANVLVNRVGH